jgi:hypothetical protein
MKKLILLCISWFLCYSLSAQDYIIDYTFDGDDLYSISITDNSGNSETLTMSQNGSLIRFENSNTSSTYSIDGGPITEFTTPADVLSPILDIFINTAGGNDIINIGAFTTDFFISSLNVNGGTGNDVVNFNGDITFPTNNNLNVDLQNDDATPGIDAVNFAANANIKLQGTGTATIKVSKNITFNTDSSLLTEDGDLTLEANMQETPTADSKFIGILINGATVGSTGSGNVTIKGKGGFNAEDVSSISSTGISLVSSGDIIGGEAENSTSILTIEGYGATTSTTNLNVGVSVYGGSQIGSEGGAVSVKGYGGGTGASALNYGVFVFGSSIFSVTSVVVEGTGGESEGNNNIGVFAAVGIPITESYFYHPIHGAGNTVTVRGYGGGTGASANNVGVYNTGGISQSNLLDVYSITEESVLTIEGIGGDSEGDNNVGVYIASLGVTTLGNLLEIKGTGGGSGTDSDFNVGVTIETVLDQSPTHTSIKSLYNESNPTIGFKTTINIEGIGGQSTGGNNHGIYFINNRTEAFTESSPIISTKGNVTLTGTKGSNSESSSDIQMANPYNDSYIVSEEGNVTINATNSFVENGHGAEIRVINESLILGTDEDNKTQIAFLFAGTTPNLQYAQLNVVGKINLTNAKLICVPLLFQPSAGQTFVIVNNDGTDAITGTFSGLAEGVFIFDFLSSGLAAKISYVGGDGNDVELTVIDPKIPKNLKVDNVSNNVSNITITLSWDEVTVATVDSYEIRYKKTSDANYPAQPQITGITALNYVVTGLENGGTGLEKGTTYEFQVRAKFPAEE